MHGSIYLDDAINTDWEPNTGLVSRWMSLPDHRFGVKWWDLCKRNHGTLTNMDPPTDWVAKSHTGWYGALELDGSNDYIRIPRTASIEPVNELTVFVDLVPLGSFAAYPVVVRKSDDFGAPDVGFSVAIGGGGEGWIWEVVNAAGLQVQTTSTTITAGINYRMCFAFKSGEQQQVYANGIQLATRTPGAGNITWDSDDFTIGMIGVTTGTAFLNCLIMDVRYYGRWVSAAEVRELYEDSLAGSPNSLKWYKRKAYSFAEVAAAGNRRRRCLIGGAA